MSEINTRLILSDPWVYCEQLIFEEPMSTKPHRHSAWQFSAVLKETIIYHIKGEDHIIDTGGWILFPAELIHSVYTKKPFASVMQLFFSRLPRNLLPEAAEILNFRHDLVLQGKFEPEFLRYIANRFITRMQPERMFHQSWSRTLPQIFILEALSGLGPEQIGQPVHATDAMTQVLFFMERHYAEPLGLDDLARKAGLSVGRFNTVFHELTGTSPMHYLQRIRLNRAQNLLLSGISIHEAARQCGFATVQYFYRCFKQAMGQTPGMFKKQPYHSIITKIPLR